MMIITRVVGKNIRDGDCGVVSADRRCDVADGCFYESLSFTFISSYVYIRLGFQLNLSTYIYFWNIYVIVKKKVGGV